MLLSRRHLPSEAQVQLSASLAGTLNWSLVLERAKALEILPLICRSLANLDFPHVPEDVRTLLVNTLRVNAMRNEFLKKELARLLRLFREAQIPVVVLKGIPQAESLYGDPALRDCCDNDLLVSRDQILPAIHLATSAGYKPFFPQPGLTKLLASYRKDCLLIRDDGINTYMLDLHCGLIWGGALERQLLEEIWQDVSPKNFYGVPALTLNPDWEFLYLAIHAFKHGLSSLKYLVDLDRFCTQRSIDWQGVEHKAKRWGWDTAVSSTLADCASLLETPVSPAFRPPSALPSAASRLAAPEPPSDFLAIELLKTPAQKLRFIAIRLFIPSPDTCTEWPLPESQFFLYYVLQPLRMTGKFLAWLLQSGANRS